MTSDNLALVSCSNTLDAPLSEPGLREPNDLRVERHYRLSSKMPRDGYLGGALFKIVVFPVAPNQFRDAILLTDKRCGFRLWQTQMRCHKLA
jgi:hypothetical protein